MEQEKFMRIKLVFGYDCWKLILLVLFDGELEKHNRHPNWEIAYYEGEGNAV